ncbi:CSTF3 [Lepeophtheirus salmonis]|uniref:CSTF3 n=1 Tax=Lepeophtheirus salmonis TaxID=72036 RepID=A0A7R8HE21_LEPSM|nr:CSTF3 [Lepeophtheirus salmonis]CAF3046598.1 CSTF3 [Lepeophtheirus salmonis]
MNIAPHRLRDAERRIEDDVYDMEAWQLVIKDAQSKKAEKCREIFEEVFKDLSYEWTLWKMYIEQEMRSRNYEKVEKLFQRCLMKIMNIELWKTYLLYVKDTKINLSSYKEKMAQAYDFALEKMGIDIASYPLWNEYIKFLKGGIVNPMVNIEVLWKDYVAFEQGINPIIAEKMTSERSRDYMNARRVSKEYEACTRGLVKTAPCVPPSSSIAEQKQVEYWQKYINWEKSNPLRVEDQIIIAKRVMFAYEQCLLCLAHHPNIWYEAALFLQDSSRILAEKGDRGISGVLNKCMLLHFAYADFEEQRMKYEKVHKIYLKLLEHKDVDPTLCYVQYMKFCRRSEGIKSARAVFKKAREDDSTGHQIYASAALMEYYCTKDKDIAVKIFELGLRKFQNNKEYILAYIDYLSHLNEDNNTRVLFERVLTSGQLPSEDSAEIWSKFLEFESKIGDLASIIKVERRRTQVLDSIGQQKTNSYVGSDPNNLLPDGHPANPTNNETIQLIDRYRFMDLYPCTKDELRSLGYQNKTLDPELVLSQTNINSNSISGVAETENVARPDVSQMIPFKPKSRWVPGEHPMPGGGFPLPPSVSDLCQLLPPPSSFNGPFVIIDRMLDIFKNIQLPDSFQGKFILYFCIKFIYHC